MRRLVLKADLSVDGYLGRDGTDADWVREYYDEELTRYQARVVQKAGVHALEADWSVDALAELKEEGGHVELAPIVAQGGSAFCLELSLRRLVDEYRVVVHPVVFGEGDRLFAVPDRFYLIGTNFFRTGSLAHTYIPVDAYRDRPPPYPWSAGTQGPGEDDDDPEPHDPPESPAPG